MFSRYSNSALWLVALALGLVAALSGCQGDDVFARLDQNQDKVLTAGELDVNSDRLVTPEELEVTSSYSHPIDIFFAHGDSAQDQSLTREEFSKALQGDRMDPWLKGLIALAVVIAPIVLGFQLGNWLRMPEQGWKLAVILFSVVAGVAIVYFGWPPKRGIDLSGGVILIYEIDEEATLRQLADDETTEDGKEGAERAVRPEDRIQVEELVTQLRRRINPGGVQDVVIRKYGERQVEIIIPGIEAAEVEYIKQIVQQTGQLEFLIVATDRDSRHQRMIAKAKENIASRDRMVSDTVQGQEVMEGRWVPVGVEEKRRGKDQDYHGVGANDILRARRGTGRSDDPFVAVEIPPEVQDALFSDPPRTTLKKVLDRQGYRDLQVLMYVQPNEHLNIKGHHVRLASPDFDQQGNWAVRFQMTPPGATFLGQLTSDNRPDVPNNDYRRLGIIMDNELLSAPRLLTTISDSGQITGNFTQDEVTFLVDILRAGRLPAALRPEPISQNVVSALLGDDTIRSGSIAIGLSMTGVFLFLLAYYRFPGVIACYALFINLLLTVALMMAINASFTLPGLAGLALSVGMAVDANVLIFERIREELERGSALRMAIRNGFARATTTIIDSNLTTLITGFVLYIIGTDQIRGFAVTLIIGLILNLFTAIFCSKVIFEIVERKRWITTLKMWNPFGRPNFDFMKMKWWFIGMSWTMIIVGMIAVVARGKDIFDIDFNGGTSVEVLFEKSQPIEEVRRIVTSGPLGKATATKISVEGFADGRVYKIDSPITGEEPPEVGDPVTYKPPGAAKAVPCEVLKVDPEKKTADLKPLVAGATTMSDVSWGDIDRDGVQVVQKRLTALFGDSLAKHEVTVKSVEAVARPTSSGGTTGSGASAVGSDDDLTPPDTDTTPSTDNTPPDTTPPADPAPDAPAEGDGTSLRRDGYSFVSLQIDDETEAPVPGADVDPADAAPSDESDPPETEPAADPAAEETTPPDTAPTETIVAEEESPGETTAPATAAPPASIAGQTSFELTFKHDLNAASVRALLQAAVNDLYGHVDMTGIELSNPEWDRESSHRYKEWDVEMPLSEAATRRVLDKIQAEINNSPVWLSSNKIGAQVAGDLREKALVALLVSMFAIVAYIWVRFQHMTFGLAAVVALVHDVLITLGAVAASLWLSYAFGWLGVEDFKINLTVIAALLTVVGYSINDTIVVFDRLREVRGKNPDMTEKMVNDSCNQTLSRTMLTGVTSLMVLLILYFLGGESIRGFAFALLVGILVGTYSSIFIASPFVLWMMGKPKKSERPEKAKALV